MRTFKVQDIYPRVNNTLELFLEKAHLGTQQVGELSNVCGNVES